MIKKSGISVVKDKVSSILEGLRSVTKTDVLVGIPGKTTLRREGPMNNAQLGYIHENGAPEANIPPRPFLYPGVKEAKAKIMPHMMAAAKQAVAGNQQQANQSMHRAGLVATNAVKRRLTTGPFTPLAASTIRRRRARGRTGTKPLIDTGQLRNSITYVVRDK